MAFNPAFRDRVRYTLFNDNMGLQTIDEPIGWQDDDKEISRNEDYHGIFAKFSSALKFVGNGADYIKMVYDLYGIEANIRLTKDERHPQTDLWIRAYDGDIDLSTYEVEDNVVSVKLNNSGYESILKSRENEKVEIDRITTMDGKVIDPLRVDTVALNGRRILLNTVWDVQPIENTATAYVHADPSSGGSDRYRTVGVPINMIAQSHENAQSILPETYGNELQGTTGLMFFAVSDVNRVVRVKLSIDFTTNVSIKDDVNHGFYRLCFSKYIDGTDYIPVGDPTFPSSKIVIWSSEDNGDINGLGGDYFMNPFTGQNDNPPKQWHVEWEGDLTILAGESYSLEFYIKGNLGGTFHDGSLQIKAENIDADMSIVEDSYFEPSQSKFILAYEMANRLIEIMTGSKTALKSEILGRTDLGYSVDGLASLTGYTHGFWVRKFDALPASTETLINPFKPLTTSWREFISSNQAVWNIGLGIERTGYQEKIVIEDLAYFYQRHITVRLPNKIQNAKRSVATNYYYSGLELGYAKGGDYSEANGLDEYNARSTFTTFIKRLKNTFSRVSEYRADSYGKEFARRKPKLKYPTEDTSYDTDVFMMDLKRNPNDAAYAGSTLQYTFEERLWQDDFAQQPTGTYSPETATNLRFSPVNMLLRHGWEIAAGLVKYANEYIRYGSSTANSSLSTKLIGGNEYAENGNILNSELKKARYIPETIEFDHDVTTQLMQVIEGYTVINGKRIPNVYGMFEFIDENNNRNRGYLLNLKPNDSKFKLLIANT